MIAPIQSLANMEYMLYGCCGTGYGSNVPSYYNNYCVSAMPQYSAYGYNPYYNYAGYGNTLNPTQTANPSFRSSQHSSSATQSQSKHGVSDGTRIAAAVSTAVAAGAIKPQELEKIAKYSAGKAISDSEKLTFGGIFAFPLIMEGGKWALRFFGIGQAKGADGKRMRWGKNMKRHWEILRGETESYQALKGKGFQSVVDAWKMNSQQESIKLITEQVEKAEKGPRFFRKWFNMGSPASPIGTYANGFEKQALIQAEAGKMSGFKRFLKGNKLFLILFGAMEALTNVIPTFKQLGVGKGIKQTIKSTINVGVDLAGFSLGMKAGTVIGGLFGPAGAAVGAFLGQAAGIVLSHVSKKISKKIIGEDELKIAEDEEAKKLADAARTNPQQSEALLTNAVARIQQEGLTEENKEIAETIQKLAPYLENAQNSSANPFA